MARRKKYEIPIQLIELEEENYHILVEMITSDNSKIMWLVDTGASKTVFDMNLDTHFQCNENESIEIKSAGIGEGHIETKSGQLFKIKFGQALIDKLEVALINLDHVNGLYSHFTSKRIAGLIGSDFLVKYQAKIDYKKLVLSLYV